MTEPGTVLIAFARALRAEGLPGAPDRTAAFCRAAALLSPSDLYWAGRATLVSLPRDIPIYDAVFLRFFGAPRRLATDRRPAVSMQREAERSLASADERLRKKSFALCNEEELAELARLAERLRVNLPRRRTRRRRIAPSGSPDLPSTLRRSFRTGGEPVRILRRDRVARPRSSVLLLDVSGSMASASRGMLLFAHAVARAGSCCETFCFGTRLTRLSASSIRSDAAGALRAAAAEVADWHGGTRIGAALTTFLAEHAGLARGAVVVICSDGLEVGDPAVVGAQMARLSRIAYRVVWLNPLKEHPDYEPLAGGMRAALPHVDRFSSGHSLESLEALGAELSGL